MSLYWDDFEKRIDETVSHFSCGTSLPVRRVAVFITEKCNFSCDYCNAPLSSKTMKEEVLVNAVKKYPEAIFHITGGEPSCVDWLYPFIEKTSGVRFHLNTNGYIKPPRNIKRLKISLDSFDPEYFNTIVGKKDAFERVTKNIKESCDYTVVSITCTLTKENYKQAPEFMKYCRENFPGLYAVFFSIYKGTQDRFRFNSSDVDLFFNDIRPLLLSEMDDESRNLFLETVDEKRRLIEGVRFPENDLGKTCFISLSERVINADGKEFGCSHLYRDKVDIAPGKKDIKCVYGCNRRLVMFNEEVEKKIEIVSIDQR